MQRFGHNIGTTPQVASRRQRDRVAGPRNARASTNGNSPRIPLQLLDLWKTFDNPPSKLLGVAGSEKGGDFSRALLAVDCGQLAAAVGPASLLAGVDGFRSPTFPSMPQQAASFTAAANCRQSTDGQSTDGGHRSGRGLPSDLLFPQPAEADNFEAAAELPVGGIQGFRQGEGIV